MVMLPRSVRISNLCLNELVSSQNAISKMENAVSVKKKAFHRKTNVGNEIRPYKLKSMGF